jgi:hypothetical protein
VAEPGQIHRGIGRAGGRQGQQAQRPSLNQQMRRQGRRHVAGECLCRLAAIQRNRPQLRQCGDAHGQRIGDFAAELDGRIEAAIAPATADHVPQADAPRLQCGQPRQVIERRIESAQRRHQRPEPVARMGVITGRLQGRIARHRAEHQHAAIVADVRRQATQQTGIVGNIHARHDTRHRLPTAR